MATSRSRLFLLLALNVALVLYWILSAGHHTNVVDVPHDLHVKPPVSSASTQETVSSSSEETEHDGSSAGSKQTPYDVMGGDKGALQHHTNPYEADTNPECPQQGPQYSSFTCLDYGDKTFVGGYGAYGFTITNRSCRYDHVEWSRESRTFIFYAPPSMKGKLKLMPVTLASRPYDLPAVQHRKRTIIRKKVDKCYEWTPQIEFGPIPCQKPREKLLVGYYTPIVAPWNYAHTLFCDLFALFWQMYEHGITSTNMQVIATSTHYGKEFPLPNKNKAFEMFSKRPTIYDTALPNAVYQTLLAGGGTKSWSWVTPEYSASGNPHLWSAFRTHLISVTGAVDRKPRHLVRTEEGKDEDAKRPIRVSFCVKRDKRGVVNYDEVEQFLKNRFADQNVEFALESGVGKSAKDQVQMMIDADVYMCNEGTLATSFFLMPPGSVFLSLPLVYHQHHLHQRNAGNHFDWWRKPDGMRPDPRKNMGGNIDWFPPAIKWVHTLWYDQVPLNETVIQSKLGGLRNYMPEMSIILQERKLVPLVKDAVAFVRGKVPTPVVEQWSEAAVEENQKSAWSLEKNGHVLVYPQKVTELREHYRTRSVKGVDAAPPPNYSINANLCRQLLQLTPELTQSFNTARCYISMSWLCEMLSNTKFRWRMLHPKWVLSKGRCGNEYSSVAKMGLYDPRVHQRSMEEYLFYGKEELRVLYTTTDLGNFTVSDQELDEVFSTAKKN